MKLVKLNLDFQNWMNLDTNLSCLIPNIIMKDILNQDDQQCFMLSLPIILPMTNIISS